MLTMIFVSAAVVSACTAARWYLCRAGRRETEHWGGRVRLTALWNSGGAFGLPIGRRPLLALSNLWERLRRGRVYDYLRFPKAPGPLGRYVYNLADLAIFLGAAGLLLGRRRR